MSEVSSGRVELGKDEILELLRNSDVGTCKRVCLNLWRTGLGLSDDEQAEVYRAIKDFLWKKTPNRQSIVSLIPFEEQSRVNSARSSSSLLI